MLQFYRNTCMYLVTFERSHKQQHCTVPCFAGFVKKPDDVRY